MTRCELIKYITDSYNAQPEYLWKKYPTYAIFRHKTNCKWFTAVMTITKDKLGIGGNDMIDIFNVKCDPLMIGSLRTLPGIFPAYHMSKSTWISVALDGSADDETVKMLLDISWEITKSGKTRKKPNR